MNNKPLEKYKVFPLTKLSSALISSLLLLSCQGPDNCSLFPGGPIDIASKLTVGGKSYYLVFGAYGFQEKYFAFNLYDSNPELDNCGNSKRLSTYSDSIEQRDSSHQEIHISNVYLVTPNRLLFKYVPGSTDDMIHYKDMPLELYDSSIHPKALDPECSEFGEQLLCK